MTDPQPPARARADPSSTRHPNRSAAPSPADPRRSRRPASVPSRARRRRRPGRRRPVRVRLRARSAQGDDPGHAGRRGGRVPAVLGRLPIDHPGLRRRPGRSQGADRRSDPRHDRRPRRPVLGLPQPGGVPPVAPGPVRPVRRDRRPGRDPPGERRRCLHRDRGRLRVHRGRADSRRAGREGRPAGRGSDHGHRRRDGRRVRPPTRPWRRSAARRGRP